MKGLLALIMYLPRLSYEWSVIYSYHACFAEWKSSALICVVRCVRKYFISLYVLRTRHKRTPIVLWNEAECHSTNAICEGNFWFSWGFYNEQYWINTDPAQSTKKTWIIWELEIIKYVWVLFVWYASISEMRSIFIAGITDANN